MPSKVKLFDRNQGKACSRSDLNIMIPCRNCIKCLLYNQEKKMLKIPKTPETPSKNRTVIMSTGIELIPEYKLENLDDSPKVKKVKKKDSDFEKKKELFYDTDSKKKRIKLEDLVLTCKSKDKKVRKNKKDKAKNLDIKKEIEVEDSDISKYIRNEDLDNIIEKTDLYNMTLKYLDDPQQPASLQLPLFYLQ